MLDGNDRKSTQVLLAFPLPLTGTPPCRSIFRFRFRVLVSDGFGVVQQIDELPVRVVEGHLARDIHSFRGTAEPPAVVVRQLLKDLLEFFIHLFQLLLLGEEKLDQKIFVQPFKLLFGKPGLHVPPPVSLYPLYRKWRF